MVVVLLAHGFEESEAIVPVDLLRRANIEVLTAGVGGREIVSSHGVTVLADALLEDMKVEDVELIFLPGGLKGVDNLSQEPQVAALVQEVASKGKYVTAICAAPTLLGSYGLLEGKKAVCYPGMEGGLTGADVQLGTPVVADGKLVTGEAAGSALPFGLRLVELLRGRPAAEEVARAIHYHGSF